MITRGSTSASVVLALLMASASARAQSLCVDCAGPDRTYNCTVKDSARVAGMRGSGRALEFVCISELARMGGHQNCRVSTTYAGPCMGQSQEIDLAKVGRESVVIGKPPEQPEGAGGATVVPATKGPPQTLEELARETMSKSKAQMAETDEKIRKAGDAVGGAFKKTWDCLASLFSRC